METPSQINNNRPQIGFKVTDNKLAVIEQTFSGNGNRQGTIDANQILRIRGMEQGILLLQEYFSDSVRPFIKGEERHQYYMNKFKQIRYRFFEEI